VTFSLGVNDNLIVDGDRDVTITAAVYIQSCSCSAVGEEVGVSSQTIHIVDNDGPSLTLTSSRSILLEGAEEATILTISRNTSQTEALEVSLTSSYDEGLDYTHNVIIPAGKKSVTVTVKALPNLKEGDSTTITFTVKAQGHSDGVCWAMVSDQTLPDATITSIELLTANGEIIGKDGIPAGTSLQVNVTIANTGVIELPTGLEVYVYTNKGTNRMTTTETIPASGNTVLSFLLTAPEKVGTLTAYAKVNTSETVRELTYANNTSTTASVAIHAPFMTTVNVDKSIIHQGDSVTISGQIVNRSGGTWTTGDSTLVQLYLIVDGQKYADVFNADKEGRFSYVWTPVRSQIGHVGIGACYPGETIRDEMASVDIYGMRFTSNSPISFSNTIGKPYSGTFAITNPSRAPLTGLVFTVTNNPDEADIVFDAPETIGGGETVAIGYTLTGGKIGGNNDWQEISFRVTTKEGPELSRTIYYYTRNERAQLSSSIQQINTTMIKGTDREYAFDIANIGMGETGLITLSLPQWMQSVTPQQMSSMALGDTTQVVLRFVPTDDMQLNVPVTGQIAINCENADGLAIPFRIEPVSENIGRLVVDVCDEYTYYTDEAPHVSGATVTLQHPTTGAVVVRDTTSTDGTFDISLPEGYYKLTVTHPKHHSYSATLLLDPGKTTYKIVNLSVDAIKVEWEVVETTVEDTYEIQTSVKYETNVPAPIVTVTTPQSIPAKALAEGESLVFYAVLTNVGLITAQDVQLAMPEGFSALSFLQLDYADQPFSLAPQQSVAIPVKVTNIGGEEIVTSRRRTKNVDNDPCYANFPLAYFWECGTDRKWHKYPTGLRVGDCYSKSDAEKGGSGGGENGGFPGLGWINVHSTSGGNRPNYPSFGTNTENSSSNQNKVESTGEPYQCQPCSNSALLSLAKFIPIVGDIIRGANTVKEIANCISSAYNETGLHDKMAGCKYTAGVVNAYDKFAQTAEDAAYNLTLAGHYSNRMIDHMRNNSVFTDDCMQDLKNMSRALFNVVEDAGSMLEQGTDAYEKTKNSLTSIGNNIKNQYDELVEARDAYEEANNRRFFRTEEDSQYLLDTRTANGESSLSIERREREYQERYAELYQYYGETEMATMKDLDDLSERSLKMLVEGKLSKSNRDGMAKDFIRLMGQSLWNAHDFAEKSKELSVPQQDLLKNAYLDTTDKLVKAVDKLDDVTDLLHYTFGECEYEGDEEPEHGPGGGGSHTWSRGSKKSMSVHFNEIPASYRKFLDEVEEARNMIMIQREQEMEFYGDQAWLSVPDIQMVLVSWAMDLVKELGPEAIDNPNIVSYCPDGISVEQLQRFLHRWYDSHTSQARARLRNVEENGNGLINYDHMAQLSQQISEHVHNILGNGGNSIEEVVQQQLSTTREELTGRVSSVCASITLQFNQTMTMTRQAFRGTLKVFNGNQTEAMKDITLQLEVTNTSDGTLATSHEMQINAETLAGFDGPLNFTDGWTLGANETGTATILFIPSKYAAPTEPVAYTFGGRLKYLDPFSGLMVTRELSPVTLTVKPSPELDLTYFMQRDVYGDDPLTLDVVEPMKPAEFALLINNKGYGDATNVRMVTQQPEIIDNEKGLIIDFQLISSQVNGDDAALSFGKQIANDFGTIPAHSQMYAQWWLTSTLLGHFTDYDVQATHVSSYGNPDLSLLDEVTIHELIHGFDMPEGSLTGGPKTGRAFLVNDIADANDLPDKLYFSNGETASVSIGTMAKIERTSPTTCLLTITPSAVGWNYGFVSDPTQGYAELKSIVRQSNGMELGGTRFWQTDRTLVDSKEWLYENQLHFVDDFESIKPVTYLLTFDPVPDMVLEVASIASLPKEGKIAEEPIEMLNVTFNKEIDASTFTCDDITFSVQGVKQDASQIGISTEDNKSFTLDMATLTEQCPNGYYTLTVQTSGITDTEGFQGKTGKQVGWILFRGGLVQLQTSAWPLNAGTITRKYLEESEARNLVPANNEDANTAKYGSTVILVAEPETGYEFTNWTLNGEVVSTDAEYVTTALGDMNVVANFTKKKYTVNVNVESTGGRTEGTATGIYEYGTEINIIAIPDEDFMLKGWMVNSEDVQGSGNKLSITVNKALDIKATFKQEFFRQSMTLAKGWNWISTYLHEPLTMADLSKYANRIISQDTEVSSNPEDGMMDNFTELPSGKAYKIEANSNFTNSFRGHLYDTATNPINLQKGWNWVAFPYMTNTSIDAVTTAEEGDFIASQKGFAEFADGIWAGTFDTFKPGEGYLYKSVSEKCLTIDTTKTVSESRIWKVETPTVREQHVDIRRYPNTMNVTAQIYRDHTELTGDNYIIYAWAGDELRGISQQVSGNHYLTVYGEEAVEVSFVVESAETGEIFVANETLKFCDDVVGSRKKPFIININTTGIDTFDSSSTMTVYTLEGILISRDATQKTLLRLPKGIYIVNGQKRFIKSGQ